MKKILLLALLAFMPQITNARVYISEVMYDLEGADTGREWIEIHNDTDTDLDLSTYFIYENSVAHKITGGRIVPAGGYAVIADSVDKFLLDWAGFTYPLFDSVFSLSNTGEELVLLNSLKIAVDNLSYSPDLGAVGNGNSLQFHDGVLIPGVPTPGVENVEDPVDEGTGGSDDGTIDSGTGGSDDSTHSDQNDLSNYTPKIKTKTGIGRNRKVLIGSPIKFKVEQSSVEEKGKYFWNFGDGNTDEGKKVENVYKHPGEYNVVLNAYFGDYKTTSRVKIYVEELSLEITQSGSTIQIKNTGKGEINIGDFVLRVDDKKTVINQDTILSKGHSLFFDTKLDPNDIIFEYPNRKKYYSNKIEKAEAFCKKAKEAGLSCNSSKIAELFDRI